MPVDEQNDSAEKPAPYDTNEEDIENIPCDPVPGDEPSEASFQDVLALVNKVPRKGATGKELDPKQFDDNGRKGFEGADEDQ